MILILITLKQWNRFLNIVNIFVQIVILCVFLSDDCKKIVGKIISNNNVFSSFFECFEMEFLCYKIMYIIKIYI